MDHVEISRLVYASRRIDMRIEELLAESYQATLEAKKYVESEQDIYAQRRNRLRRTHVLKVAISVASMEITSTMKDIVQNPAHSIEARRSTAKFALQEQALLLAMFEMLGT
jgi:hypothetical protein